MMVLPSSDRAILSVGTTGHINYGRERDIFISNYPNIGVELINQVEHGAYRKFIKRDKRKNFKVNK